MGHKFSSNPKIDLYDAGGQYIASTNYFRLCREALAYFQARCPKWHLAMARIDHRK